ncbi:MAG: response regulator transcription factor [Burkholderiales bacterium]|jgi:two-component system response regulator AlgR|nr:response regulator transcription factor [Burkholderiales bacterium]
MTLRVLIVDDEPLARARLRTLLGDCADPTAQVVAEAGNATQAMDLITRERFDLALIDIHMPGADGLKLAQAMRGVDRPPMVVFVTAHPGHAVTAFELDAVDYLTKPVRIERLRQALVKAERFLREREAPADEPVLVIQDRGRTERVPFAEILYFKAELKYVTVRTAARSYILDGSLAELEARLTGQFLRIHRNALVARRAVRSLEKHYSTEPGEEGEGWAIRLTGVQEVLAVSRRQLAAVREAIASG